jgi:tRNA-dihydrouridine synthase B
MWFNKINRPIIGLAPMFGYSNKNLRLKARQAGADVVFTEMTAVEAIIRDVEKAWQMCSFDSRERPVIIQVFGSNPLSVSKAIKIIDKKLHPDGIDINFGCPVQKAAKQGFGSVLLNDTKLSYLIIKSASSATKLPISIKMRLPSKKPSDSIDFIKMAKKAGAKVITVHGRTQTQKYGGHADWNLLHKIKKSFKDLPILGSGDINSLKDLQDKIGNLDGALIGRAAKKDYLIFKELILIKQANQQK